MKIEKYFYNVIKKKIKIKKIIKYGRFTNE